MSEVNQQAAVMDTDIRDKVIVRTSMTGIAANALLAVVKAAIGIITGSIAITMDAVNNLSDAMSSVITIIGTRLAGRAPDKIHPLGHGRLEYLTAAVISLIVLYAGITALMESLKKVVRPVTPEYTTLSLAIVAGAIVVKVLLGLYVKKKGQQVNSDSLLNSASDALLDSAISCTTLIAAAVYLIFDIKLEAILGAVISIVIIISGLGMLKSTISQIIGERVDSKLSRGIKKTISEFDDVYGAYDLLLDNYGPEKIVGSVHIEVPDVLTAQQIDVLARKIQHKIFDDYGVILATVGIYSYNTKDDNAAKIRDDVTAIAMKHKHVLEVHGFYLDEEEMEIRMDIIVDFTDPDAVAKYRHIREDIQKKYPQYKVFVHLDYNLSD